MKKRLNLKVAQALMTGGRDVCRVWVLAAVLIVALELTGLGQGYADTGKPEGELTEGFVYFRDSSGMSLRAVSKLFPRSLDAHELGMAVLEAVMAGPPAKDLAPVFSPGANVTALFITPGNDAYVDVALEGGRMTDADTLTELLGIYSLVNSLTVTVPEIRRVKFLVNGVENESFGGHVSLFPFFKTNMLIVK